MLNERRSLLSSQSRVQAPWVKVTIGAYTFGVFDKKTKKDNQGFFSHFNVQYPSYIKRLGITKINGKVNQYTLVLDYPIRPNDDPNLIEKILSSVSSTRKIIFSYGDATTPATVYKNEEAMITNVTQTFNLEGSIITYTINAVSTAILGTTGSFTFANSTAPKKPSDEIRRVFNNKTYGLQNLFTGMTSANLNKLIPGDDKAVVLETKTNIAPLDYIIYLVGCMVPAGSNTSNVSKDLYILTIHDDTTYDALYYDTISIGGPYFKITRTSNVLEKADAYEIDVGYNTSTIVRQFSVEHNENYSIYYNYNTDLAPENYARRINDRGLWEDIYAPMYTSGNEQFETRIEDTVWFTKLTKYPISATIKIQGLLRPATLMQYIRLNVVFPGGRKHISSGLYIVTKQMDEIDENAGYNTTLSLTRIAN